METVTWVVIAIVVLLVLVIIMYNVLIGKKNQCEEAFATMDVQLKKRYELIPNIVNTVKQYMKHESELLTRLTEIRTRALSGSLSDEETVSINKLLGRSIGGIMVAVEAYPDLKASDNFIQLQRTLNEVEEQLSAARRFFNNAIVDYNNSIEMFPTNLMAGMMGYKRRQVFEIEEHERQNVNVGALFNS